MGAFQYSAVPIVTSDPANSAIIVGESTSFSAAASDGIPTPTNVQWQISTDSGATFSNLSDDSTFSGSSSAMLSISDASAALNGDEFRAVFSNAAGLTATTSAATLTVTVPSSIAPLAGALQSATVASPFAPLEALVTDSLGNPVSGANVTFTEASGSNGAGGTFASDSTVTTNGNGVAIAPTLTAGDTAGAFTVTASVNGVASPAEFHLTATPSTPAIVSAVAGTPQSTPIGTAYANLLQAEVVDAHGNPLPDVPVTFTAPLAGPSGTFNALAIVPTNGLGIATAPLFTANHALGSFTVTASVSGVGTPADFTLTNTAVPAAIHVLEGSGQRASVTSSFSTALTARVTDAAGHPVSGIAVDFELPGSAANGTFASLAQGITNANGVATAPGLTANTVAGNFTVSAWVQGVTEPATFSLMNLPLGPSGVNLFADSGQTAALGKKFAHKLQAQVVDQYGNPVSGATVIFTAPSSGPGATFAGKKTTSAVSGANGIAAVAITANRTVGDFQVVASIAHGSTTATFDLTNSPIYAIKVIAGSPQTAKLNTAYGMHFEVEVVDAAGHPLQGVSITFQAPGSGASGRFASSAIIVTDQHGIAKAPPFTANNAAGEFLVTASLTSAVSGVSTALFELQNVAPSHA